MSQKVKKILRWGLLVVAIVTAVLVISRIVQNSSGDASYEEALHIATSATRVAQPTDPGSTESSAPPESSEPESSEPTLVWVPAHQEEDEYMQKLKSIDLAALQQTNPDVVGWIWIPSTRINYPVMQGEDNQFYLKHTWEGKGNSMGSIFLECENSPNFTDFSTILYGHNMGNGSMFAAVTGYMDQWFADNYPNIYIVNSQGIWRYEVFSAFRAGVDSQVYGLSYQQEQTRQDLIDLAVESSVIETGVIPATTDRILTLSTCTGSGYDRRNVVMARLEMIQVEQ